MLKVLRLTSSILGASSVSTELTDAVIESLRVLHGKDNGVQIVERDLSATPIPHVDNAWLQALMTPEADRSDEQQAKVAFSDSLIAEGTEGCRTEGGATADGVVPVTHGVG